MRHRYDEKIAEAFFHTHYPCLYPYALYLVSDEETARDLCQEVFLRWFRLEDPDRIENPRAWLKKVLGNLAYNHLRRRKLQNSLEVNTPVEMLEARGDMENHITHIEVEEILSRLRWKEQVLLKMRMAGSSYSEIAESLEISIGSVGTLLARAMKKFRQEYEGKEVGEDEHVPGRRTVVAAFGRRT